MPTREEVLALLDSGMDYPTVGASLGIHPGLAHLIATGLPADGSDALTEREAARPGLLQGSTQHLSNPPAHAPDAEAVVQQWMRQRVGRDPQMVEATKARTATPGPIQDPEGTTDVLTVLTRQHDQVVALVKQLDTIPGVSKGGTSVQASERESIVDMITKMLSAHETAEEEHLWPQVRRALENGNDWAGTGLEQEQQATETLHALAKADPQTEDFDDLVDKLMSQLHKHVAFEDRLFLQLRNALAEDERSSIGTRILAAQRHAPTRPHPHAPREPGPVVAAAAKSAVPMDRARDATRRPADREGRPDPSAESSDPATES